MKPLAEYRKNKKMSQEQLSKALKEAGINVSPASIAMYETGQRTPPLNKARAIAHFFGISTDDIEFGPNGLKPTGTQD